MKKFFQFLDFCRLLENVNHQSERLSRSHQRRQTDKKNRAWLSGGRAVPLKIEELEERQLLSVTAGEYEIETLSAGYVATQSGSDIVTATANEIRSAVVATSPVASLEADAIPGPELDISIDGIDVLNLSSNPDSAYTIYLDFDGNTTSGTPWNENNNDGKDIVTPRFTLDGDTAKTEFSEAEKQAIYEIWLRVSEDYMPFNVNVTTADPGSAVLSTSGAMRVCVGGSCYDWYKKTDEGGIGGVAYVTSFNYNTDTPCFVFPAQLNFNPKSIGEASAHEVGHTLGLHHDGNSLIEGQEEYYRGANGWAPIMGAGYNQPLTQWSKGEYAGATNQEDDLLIITTQNGFSYRADDFGSDLAGAYAMKFTEGVFTTDGIIERNTDYDVFSFNTFGGDCSVAVDVMEEGGISNLDVLIEVYDSTGSVVAKSDATGTLSAALEFETSIGTYYVSVSGTGSGADYTNYGSLGAYTLTVKASAGEVYIVTTEEDIVDPDDGELSLREAVDNSGNGAVILFDSSLAGKTITLDAAMGQLEINKSLTIDASNLGVKGITVDAGGKGRVFYVTYATDENPVEMINLTMAGGAYEDGAGIYNAGILTLTDCVVTQNRATEKGGGIYNTGKLTLADSFVSFNTATENGGGVYNSGSMTVTGSTFKNNAVDPSGVSGGAIFNQNGDVAVSGAVFEGNTAPVGAAIVNLYGTLTIESDAAGNSSRLTDNTADRGAGAVYNDHGTVVLRGATLTGNKTTAGFGGAIWSESGNILIEDSSITRGSASSGGALYLNGGKLSLVNSLIARNTAVGSDDAFGGGLYLTGMDSVTLTNVTVAGNTAASGAGIYSLSDWTANNSVIATNNGGDVDTTGSANAYQVLSSYTDWTNADAGLYFEYDTTKPLFADADNADYTLAAGSQAADKGDNTLAVYEDASVIKTDLVGGPRFSNLIVDLGAYEYQVTEVPSLVVTTHNDVINPSDGLISLREAITYAAQYGETLGTVITFDVSMTGYTITLDAGLGALVLTNSVTIDASALIDVETGLPTVTIDAAAHKADPDLIGDVNDFRRVLEIVGANGDIDVVLKGLTITGGVYETEDSETNGGGIYARGVNLSVIDSVVTGNKAFGRNVSGGGIYLNGGTLTIKGSTIENNTASGRYSYGGGLFVSGGYYKPATDETDEEIEYGYIVEDSFIRGNVSYAASDSYDAYAYGGGLYAEIGSAGWILNSEISANVAGYNTLVMTDAMPDYDEYVRTGTYYAYGGGLYILSSLLNVTNTTIAGNAASAAVTGYGGGIFFYYAKNDAGPTDKNGDPELYPKGNFHFYNSILVENFATTYGYDLYNKIPNASGSTQGTLNAYLTLSAFTDWTNADEAQNFTYNPSGVLFEETPLFEEGILTNADDVNLMLVQSSQATNIGDNSLAVYADGSPVLFDLIGNDRIFEEGIIDLGAYEYQTPFVEGMSLVVTTVEDIVDESDGEISLREAVDYAQKLLDSEVIEEAVITFDSALSGGTIVYDDQYGEIVIGCSLTIDAMSLYIVDEDDPTKGVPGMTVNASESSRIFHVLSTAETVTIQGLLMTGGRLFSSSDAKGGAIYAAENATLTLVESIVEQSSVTGSVAEGGAIYATGDLNLTQTVVRDSKAVGTLKAHGGGVYAGGILTMTGGKITGNKLTATEEMHGGGAFSGGDAIVTEDAEISNNLILPFAVTIDNTLPNIGMTITATVNPTDAEATYQWYRYRYRLLVEVDPETGEKTVTDKITGMETIDGAVEASYIVTDADVDFYLMVVATGTSENYAGFEVAAVTAKVVPPIQIAVSTDPPLVGALLTTTLTPPETAVTYQWYRGTDADNIDIFIDGATESSYTITKDDIGCYLKVVAVGADDTEYAGYTVYSVTTEPAAMFAVSLSNTAPELGQTISSTLNPTNAEALYQWYRGTDLRKMTPIAGANGADYTLTEDDYGCYLRVVAVGNEAYTGFIASATTETVVQSFSVSLSNLAPLIGDVVSAQVAPSMAEVTYQWYRGADAENMESIDGANGAEYTVTADDSGLLLKVVVKGVGDFEGREAEALTETVVEALVATLSIKDPIVGDTIEVNYTPAVANATFQWYRVTAEGTATPILRANMASYTVTSREVGYALKVVVSGHDGYEGIKVDSDVTNIVPAESIAVTVNGTLQVGKTVTAAVDPSFATVTWQWSRVDADGLETPIDGATGADYLITGEEIGCFLKATATGTGIFEGQTVSGVSDGTVETLSVTLSTDTPLVGTVLTAQAYPEDADVLFQWYRGTSMKTMTVITGAFSESYTASADDLGYYLRVVAVGAGEYTGYFASATTAQTVSETDATDIPQSTGAAPQSTGVIPNSVGYGGGLYSTANITVASSRVSGNKILEANTASGGGLYSMQTVTLDKSVVTENIASGINAYGGGISAATADVKITEVSNNRAEGENLINSEAFGGGVYVTQNALIRKATITGNTVSSVLEDNEDDMNEQALAFGGGVYSAANLEISYRSEISNNTAISEVNNNEAFARSFGGGVYAMTLTLNTASVLANTVRSAGSLYSEDNGGGIYITRNGEMMMTAGMVDGNQANGQNALGGGIYIGDNANLTIEGNLASDNSVSGNILTGGEMAQGGGICVLGTSAISGVTVTGNTVEGMTIEGGGIYARLAMTINVSKVISNKVERGTGGGIYAYSDLTMTNTLAAANVAKTGAGVFVRGAGTFVNVTIAANEGTGLYIDRNVTNVYNSIIATNTSEDVHNGGEANAFFTLSAFAEWTNAPESEEDGGDDEEEAILPTGATEPDENGNLLYEGESLFIGSGTDPFNLSPDSVAIDKGDNQYVEGPVDVIGHPRINGDTVDMGAYEYIEGGESPSTTVTTADDVVDSTDGLISLREAIGYAQSGDEITFISDLIGATIGLSGEYGSLVIDKDLTITAPGGPSQTITVSGGGATVFVIRGTEDFSISVTFERVNVSGGTGRGISVEYADFTHNFTNDNYRGLVSGNNSGGISVSNGSLTSNYCDYTGNGNGGIAGGGILLSNATATLTGVNVTNNTASVGGGIYSENSTVTMLECNVNNNRATSAGGGIYSEDSVFDITDININENSLSYADAVAGGAVYLYGSEPGKSSMSVVTTSNSYGSFSGNTMTSNQSVTMGSFYVEQSELTLFGITANSNTLSAYSDAFGGFICAFDSKIILDSTWVACEKNYSNGYSIATPGNTIRGSYGDAYGGALYFNSCDVTILNSMIRGNTAQGNNNANGGGIYFANANLSIVNSEISENSAISRNMTAGGGIYFANGDMTLVNNTIAFNSAKAVNGAQYSYGGGIFAYANGIVSVYNSIIAMNYAMSGANLARPDVFETDPSIDLGGNNIIDFNPYFDASAVFDDYGNITNPEDIGMYSIVTGESRAINNGNNDYAVYPDGTPISTELLYFNRIYSRDGYGVVDIGAYEYQGIPASQASSLNVVTTLQDVVDPDDGVWSLREAIYYAVDDTVIRFDSSLAGGTITLASQIFIDKPLTIEGGVEINGQIQRITLDARSASRVILQTEECTLSNFNFINGQENYVGGIYATCLTLINCDVRNCQSIGIYGLGRLVLQNCVVDQCASVGASPNYGGGVYMEHGLTKYGQTSDEFGERRDNGVFIVESSEFTDNVAGEFGHAIAGKTYAGGGAIFVTQVTTVINESVFTGNRAMLQDYTYGGAIYVHAGAGKTVISNSSFMRNVSGKNESGSGIGTHYGVGGAIYSETANGLYLTNCVLSENDATDGGAIYTFNLAKTEITNSTISGNTAIYGAGVYAFGTTIFRNSIIALNRAVTAGDDIYKGAGSLDVHYLAYYYAYNTLSTYSEWTNFQSPDAHYYVYDASKPLFKTAPVYDQEGSLTNAGSINLTLANDSQAINRGGNDYAIYPDVADNLVDRAGTALGDSLTGVTPCSANIPRILGDTVDLGAYEYADYLDQDQTVISTDHLVVTTLEDVVDASDGKISLREAIEYAGTKREDDSVISSVITFDPTLANGTDPLVITLAETLVIRKSVTIDATALYDADGNPRLTIVAAASDVNPFRAFSITGKSADEIRQEAVAMGITQEEPVSAVYLNVRLIGFGVTGGILADSDADLYGAGIFARYANLSMTDCAVFDNVAVTAGRVFGAGLWAEYGQNLTLTDCDITGNRAEGEFVSGAGVGAAFYQTITLSDTHITDNMALADVGAYGAGLGLNGGVVALTNSVVNLNMAAADVYTLGGGLFVTGTLTLTCDTVAGNTATTSEDSAAGGLHTTGMLNVNNTLISNNFAQENADSDATIISGANNIITAVDDAALFVTAARFDQDGWILNADTADFALTLGSPAIDAGNNAMANYPDGSVIEKDAAGRDRIFHGTIDIGAYEYNRLQLVVTTLQDAIDAADGLLSLREAIELAGTVTANGEQYKSTITFADSLRGGTITISRSYGELTISKDLTIDASSLYDAESGTGITIHAGGSASNLSRAFKIAAVAGESIDVELIGLTLTGGYLSGGLNDAVGGGIYAENVNLVLTDVILTGNTVLSQAKAEGGALYLTRASLTVVRGRVSNNTVTGGTRGFGGGLYLAADAGNVTIRDAYMTGNTATTTGGAGIGGALYSDSTATLSIANSQLTGNKATDGGALAVFADGIVKLTNVTVADNMAVYGGGLYLFGSVEIDNSIIAVNTATSAETADVYRGAGSLDIHFRSTVSARQTLSGYQAWDNKTEVGVVNYVYDTDLPLFDVSLYGDYLLAVDSQAIDLGDKALAVYADGSVIKNDLAGRPRVVNGVVDLGAFESEDLQEFVVVTTENDIVDANDGVISLREAILWAQDQEYSVRILFDSALTGKTITLDADLGELVITESVVIDAMSLYDSENDQPGVTISGGGKIRVLAVRAAEGQSVSVTLRGLTLTDGYLASETDNVYGAGLYAERADVTLVDCLVTNNTVSRDASISSLYAYGGGIYTTGGSLSLSSSVVSDNSAVDGGGGIYALGTMNVTDSVISGNNVNGSYSAGGGIYFTVGKLTLTRSSILDNSAVSVDFTKGGGLYLDDGDVLIQDGSLIARNRAMAGGGVYSFYNDSLVIKGSEISGNIAESAASAYGGGIYSWGDALTVTDSIIRGNRAVGTVTNGAGLYITYDIGASVVNSVIADNSAEAISNDKDVTARSAGGGVYLYYGEMEFVNATIVNNRVTAENRAAENNTAVQGGGVFVYGSSTAKPSTVTFRNSIVVLNATEDVGKSADGFIAVNAFKTLSAFIAWDNASDEGVMNYVYDSSRPLFTDQATGDYSLCVKSQAVNVGENSQAVYADGSAIKFDLAGNTRIFDGIVDLGAYEYQSQTVFCPMDIDGDGIIGPSDRVLLSAAWFSRAGGANWNYDCDIDGDGLVGPTDRNYLSMNWFKKSTSPDLIYPAAKADVPETASSSFETAVSESLTVVFETTGEVAPVEFILGPEVFGAVIDPDADAPVLTVETDKDSIFTPMEKAAPSATAPSALCDRVLEEMVLADEDGDDLDFINFETHDRYSSEREDALIDWTSELSDDSVR